MKIEEYVKKYGITVHKFSIRCGIAPHKMYRVLKGHALLNMEEAYSVYSYTNGEVSFIEMIPENSKKIVHRRFNNHVELNV